MRVWFVSPASEHGDYNDADPGDNCNEDGCDKEYCTVCYQYETGFIDFWDETKLFATEEQAVNERNKLFLEKYEKERKAHADRLDRYTRRKDALELLSEVGMNPEDLFPYGIGDEPQFSYPQPYRVGYLEVIEP